MACRAIVGMPWYAWYAMGMLGNQGKLLYYWVLPEKQIRLKFDLICCCIYTQLQGSQVLHFKRRPWKGFIVSCWELFDKSLRVRLSGYFLSFELLWNAMNWCRLGCVLAICHKKGLVWRWHKKTNLMNIRWQTILSILKCGWSYFNTRCDIRGLSNESWFVNMFARHFWYHFRLTICNVRPRRPYQVSLDKFGAISWKLFQVSIYCSKFKTIY